MKTPAETLSELRKNDWFVHLETHAYVIGLRAAAKKLGFKNHTGLSLFLRGIYPASSKSFERRARAVLYRNHDLSLVDCPLAKGKIPRPDCAARAASPVPTHNPLAMIDWRACRQCPNHPKHPGAKSPSPRGMPAKPEGGVRHPPTVGNLNGALPPCPPSKRVAYPSIETEASCVETG